MRWDEIRWDFFICIRSKYTLPVVADSHSLWFWRVISISRCLGVILEMEMQILFSQLQRTDIRYNMEQKRPDRSLIGTEPDR